MRAHNAGLPAVVAWVVTRLLPRERTALRARWLWQASALVGETDRRRVARRLWARMRELAPAARYGVINLTTVWNGALRAALLVDGFNAPSRQTVCRALGELRRTEDLRQSKTPVCLSNQAMGAYSRQ